ncbi:hypothetical protein HMPREF1624_05017 [Sporothrix schenckii ATCC 58251]|uniref:GDP/GTP exchange factor Sec2 N-terminal domain-containing protein n=1 Tax=Sporothrix schenckii (strain ATCC 58251 / de Perez 2211183) TaxID=1391915 RepID=U7PTZ1_SPOS1|nr:hypothetical protein HMPREF1624_05017 [Sporothrix schenckii ATCC 58251]
MTTDEMEKKDATVEAEEPKVVLQPVTGAFPEDVDSAEPSPNSADTSAALPAEHETQEDAKDAAAATDDAKDVCLPSRSGNHTYSHSDAPAAAPIKENTPSLRKANSTTELAANADDATATLSTPIRRLPSSLSSSSIEDQDISTIPDPRLRTGNLASGSTDTAAQDEITALSTKLIDAINRQSTLDDTLSQTRMELEESREQVRKLEALAARQKEFLSGGLWVRKSAVEEEKQAILAKSRDEKRLRLEAESAKSKIELELESLTAELFEQANIMVAAAKEEARAEQVAANRRYDNLRGQLADTEVLLKSQQEQLTQLKQVMEEIIQNGAAGSDDHTTALTTPTSPGFGQFDFKDADARSVSEKQADGAADTETTDDAETTKTDEDPSSSASVAAPAATTVPTTVVLSPTVVPPTSSTLAAQTPDTVPQSPSQPMSFTHLLRPVLRYDTNAFHEFVDLIRTAQIQLMLHMQSLPQSHVRSPSSTSLPKTPPMNNTNWNATTSNSSTTVQSSVVSMSAVNAFATVASGLSGSSNANSPQNHTKELKETRFYKRVVIEDIEPTLRLDTAPGISWLVRRNIMSAVLEGTLVAEPVPNITGSALVVQQPCSMCGEHRREDSFLRHHRFRLTESDKSTPYPLCNYCLSRVRSVCGFLVFLRMIKEGHWRAADEEAEQAAWEECVRLREHMFWARIGGGVLPANSGSGSGGSGSGSGVPNGVGSARHSRVAGGGSSAHNSISSPSQSHHANGSGSARPSTELSRQSSLTATATAAATDTDTAAAAAEGVPTKISVNHNGSPVSSPLASPLASPAINAGLGIENSSDRPTLSPSPSYNGPNRPSKLSSSMAAMVSGLGGHVS